MFLEKADHLKVEGTAQTAYVRGGQIKLLGSYLAKSEIYEHMDRKCCFIINWVLHLQSKQDFREPGSGGVCFTEMPSGGVCLCDALVSDGE